MPSSSSINSSNCNSVDAEEEVKDVVSKSAVMSSSFFSAAKTRSGPPAESSRRRASVLALVAGSRSRHLTGKEACACWRRASRESRKKQMEEGDNAVVPTRELEEEVDASDSEG